MLPTALEHMCLHTHSHSCFGFSAEAGSCPEVEEKAEYGPLSWPTSPIYVREVQICIWLVRDAPEPRTGVRNVCSSASQAYTLCEKSHQNEVRILYSTHNYLVFGVGIQAKPSLQFTWIISMAAGSIQALLHSSSSPALLILFRLHMSFLFPSSPGYPYCREKLLPGVTGWEVQLQRGKTMQRDRQLCNFHLSS